MRAAQTKQQLIEWIDQVSQFEEQNRTAYLPGSAIVLGCQLLSLSHSLRRKKK